MSEQLPNGWASVLLPEVIYFQEGPGLRKHQFRESGVPFLNIRTLAHGRVDLSKCQFLSEAEVKEKYEHFLLNALDIVVSSSGTLGKTAVIGEEDLPVMLNTSIVRMRPQDERTIERGFILQFLRSEVFLSQARAASTGTAQVNYGPSHLRVMRVPLPPLNEQRRIVAKLEALQASSRRAREALDAVPPLLEKLRQSILAAAFRGDLTKDWRAKHEDVEPASKLLERIRVERRKKWEESELAKMKAKGKSPKDDTWKAKYKEPEPVDATGLLELPEGWCWASVEELTDNFDGDRIPLKESDRAKRGGKYPYYGASGVIDDIDEYLFDGSYLLIAEDGANLLSRSTDVAFAADGKFWVNNHAHVVQTVGVPRSYLQHHLNSIRLERWVTGTAQPKLTQKALNRIPVPLCPEQEVAQLVQRLESLASQERRLGRPFEALTERLTMLDHSLLATAFRGELVPQDANDEAARVMLARVLCVNESGPKPRRGRGAASGTSRVATDK